jgi:hypothetical protein
MFFGNKHANLPVMSEKKLPSRVTREKYNPPVGLSKRGSVELQVADKKILKKTGLLWSGCYR